MKKLILLSILILSFIFKQYSYCAENEIDKQNTNSQISLTNENKFDETKGIGCFIIGKLETDIISQVKKDVSSGNYQSKIKDITNEVSEFSTMISKKLGENIVYKKHYCPDLRVWFVSKFRIGGVELQEIQLHFYKNKLFKMECNYSRDLVEGMIFKYGVGKEDKNYDSDPLTSEVHSSFRENIWENKTVYCKAYTSFEKETYILGKKINNFRHEYFILKSVDFDYSGLEKCENDYEKKYIEQQKNEKYKGL